MGGPKTYERKGKGLRQSGIQTFFVKKEEGPTLVQAASSGGGGGSQTPSSNATTPSSLKREGGSGDEDNKEEDAKVRRCKHPRGLKATRFQKLIVNRMTVLST